MKNTFLQLAGVNSEAEFYKKYPNEDAFFAEHGHHFTNKMEDGGDVNSLLTNGKFDGAGVAQAGIGALPGVLTMMDGSASAGKKGAGIGGALGGVAGTVLGGPIGGAIGSTLGSAIGGAIGAKSDRRREREKYGQMRSLNANRLQLSSNIDPYGVNDSFYAEEGGQPMEAAHPEVPLADTDHSDVTPVNIEKGELAVNPTSMDIIQKFTNKNRFAPHAANPNHEAVGNHIKLPKDAIIIPKKLANTYEQGNRVTRRSILAELLKNQVNREMKEGLNKKMAAGGDVNSDGDYINNYVDMNSINMSPNIRMPTEGFPTAQTSPYNVTPPRAPLPDNQVAVTSYKTVRPEISTAYGPAMELPGDMKGQSVSVDNVDTEPKQGFKFGHISPVAIAQGLNMIPTAVGLANAFGSDPYLDYNENENYGRAESLIDQTPTDINMEGAKAGMARNFRSYARVLNNTNSPSIRAENSNNFSKMIDATGQLYANADNERKNRIATKLGSLASLKIQQGADQEQARDKMSTEMRMDKAARESTIQKGLSEGVTNVDKMIMDNERIKALNGMSQYFNLNPYGKQLLEEDPDAVDKIVKQVLEGSTPALISGSNPTTKAAAKPTSRIKKKI